MSDTRYSGLAGFDGLWSPMAPTTDPLPEPNRSGERVVVQLLTGNGRRTVDRGELIARRTFVALVRSDQDGQVRRFRLVQHQIHAEK